MLQKLTRKAHRHWWVNPAELRLAGLFVGTIGAIIMVSGRVHPPPLLHEVALFGHLAALLVGFGSVLAVDWFGLLFLARQMTMGAVLVQAHRMTPMIWLGLLGLVLSGAFLEPDLGSSLVIVKMVCVIGVSVVGVLTLATKRQMVRRLATLPRGLMLRGMILASASQAFWWTAVIIGFHSAQT